MLLSKVNSEADIYKPGQGGYAAVRQPICRQTQVSQRTIVLRKDASFTVLYCTVLAHQLVGNNILCSKTICDHMGAE